MTPRSRLLLTTAALSLALGGGFATAQNRTHEPMQNGATQNSTQKQDQNRVGNDNSQAQAPNNDRIENNARSNENAERGARSNEQNERQPSASGNRTGQPAAAERGTERNENAAQRGGERNENSAERGGERNGNAAERSGERNQNGARNAEQHEGSSRASTRLSSAEKTKLDGAIGRINIRPATNVNFSVAVGVSVPRSIALHPLPADVVAIVPQYRDYNFFLVRDEAVIVEPRTHHIVDVIERTGGARTAETSKTRKLHLSSRDRTYIRKHYSTRRTVVDRAGPPRETHIMIGEDVPESVTIERFPREVYHRVPSIRSYGYVHEGGGLYLVEPGTRHVIEELGPDED